MADLKHGKVLRRVLALFALAAVLPIGLAAAVSYFQVKAALTEQTYSRLYNASKFHGVTVLDRLLATRAQLERLSIELTQDSAYLPPLLEDLAVQTDALVAVDAAGSRRIVSGELAAGDFLLDPIQRGQPADKAAIMSRDGSGEIFMAVSYGAATQSSGKLVALLKPSYLFGAEEDHLLSANFCVFEQHIMLYCTARLRQYLHDLKVLPGSDIPSDQVHWKSPDGRFFMSRRHLFLPSQFNARPWTVLSAEDEATSFSSIRVFRWMFPAVITLAILCVLLLVIVQTRRQLTPLAVLREGALKLGDGEFDARIALDTGDEFQELAGTFNNMADKLGTQFQFLMAMSEVDSILLSSPDLIQVTESMVRHLPQFIPASAAAILVADPQMPFRGQLFVSSPGEAEDVLVERVTIDERATQLLSGAGQYLALDTSRDVPGFLSSLAPKCSALHLFPLRYEERVLGCLCLGTSGSAGLVTEFREQAQTVADRLTVALSAVERQQRLYNQAHFDGLTGLPNRSLFIDRLSQYLVQAGRSKRRVAVLYADLDQFKVVNDTLGHAQGDEVLKQAADRFRRLIRKSDTLARLSGDEFIFALPELVDVRDAVTVVQGIIKDLREPFFVLNQNFPLSASFGIAVYPEDGVNAEVLMKNADVAMYRAKNDQRAEYRFFEESMNADIVERVALGQQLRQAVSQNHLHLVYQPKVDAITHRVHSAEALLRWHHSQLGWIDPEKFISVAEESGLIEQIGEFVITSACDQLARWRQAGYAIEQMAVNVSARQMLHTDIVGTVASALDRAGIAGSCLELELTESLLIDDFVTTQGVLLKLQQLGVGMALDDFGTGYSSLSYLHQLPFGTLKIDKSFVKEIGVNLEVDAIVESIIALAKSLGKRIVAEGIEDENQNCFLTDRGCELLQGYLYSRPLTAQHFEDVLKSGLPLPLPPAKKAPLD